MKRIVINGLVLVGVVIAVAWGTYSIGYRRGFEFGVVLVDKTTFVGTFDALQKIRAGDVETGTERIETSCFAAADTVYGDHPETQLVAKGLFNDFKRYRQTYHTNSADWSIVEQSLEKKLANWE